MVVITISVLRATGLKDSETDDTDKITVYTDGSKNEDGKTGLGAYLPDKIKITENLPDYCTVFQAEVIAIQKAAAALNSVNTYNKIIHIRSDSAASIKALHKRNSNSATIKNCNKELNMLAINNTVTVEWVKAHIGIKGNEIADSLAKEGCSGTPNNCNTPIPNSMIKRKSILRADMNTYKLFQEQGGKHTKDLINETKQVKRVIKIFGNLNNQRKKFRTLTHLLTNNGPYNKLLHKIGKADTTKCTICEEEDETAKHIIMRCPAIATLRLGISETDWYNILTKHTKLVIKMAWEHQSMKKRQSEHNKNKT